MESGRYEKVNVTVQLVSHLFLWLDFLSWYSFEGLFSTQACFEIVIISVIYLCNFLLCLSL